MEKILNFVDQWGVRITLLLVLVIFFKTCSIDRTTTKLTDKVTNLETTVSKVTPNDVDKIVSDRLFDFLIFEDDLDRKKTTLSQIKNQINEKE